MNNMPGYTFSDSEHKVDYPHAAYTAVKNINFVACTIYR
jgi:hypothetical protein